MLYHFYQMKTKHIGHQVGQLIQDWLRGPADAQVEAALTLPQRLQLSKDLVRMLEPSDDGHIFDWEEVRTVMSCARGLWLGRVRVRGPKRAVQAVEQMWQEGLQLGPTSSRVGQTLLLVRTSESREAEIDEYILISETVRNRFGIGCSDECALATDESLKEDMEVLVLVGYE